MRKYNIYINILEIYIDENNIYIFIIIYHVDGNNHFLMKYGKLSTALIVFILLIMVYGTYALSSTHTPNGIDPIIMKDWSYRDYNPSYGPLYMYAEVKGLYVPLEGGFGWSNHTGYAGLGMSSSDMNLVSYIIISGKARYSDGRISVISKLVVSSDGVSAYGNIYRTYPYGNRANYAATKLFACFDHYEWNGSTWLPAGGFCMLIPYNEVDI